jgi:hypothetical protein
MDVVNLFYSFENFDLKSNDNKQSINQKKPLHLSKLRGAWPSAEVGRDSRRGWDELGWLAPTAATGSHSNTPAIHHLPQYLGGERKKEAFVQGAWV